MGRQARSSPDASVSPRPTAAPPRPYRFPQFTRHLLPNGVVLLVAPLARLPLVTVRLLVDAGASVETPQTAGTAALTVRALAEGTLHLGGAELAEEFERLGGALDVSATWDGAHLSTTVLRGRFDQVLALLGEVLLTPSFLAREVDRLRAERLAELLELEAEPRGLADQRFSSFVYSAASRFCLPEGGSPDTVRGVSNGMVRTFYETHFRPDATTVVVVGDVSADQVLRGVESVFGAWGGHPVGRPAMVVAPAYQRRTVHVIARSGAPQSELRVGHIGIPRPHPDYFSAVVLNAILGGVFNSRVNINLRERHGFTYGAFSSFEWRRAAGPFTISTAVATDVTARAVGEILREVDIMRGAPPSPEELSHVQSFLEGVFPIRFETTEAIAGALTVLRAFDLPEDYYDSYRARIDAVTAAEVQQAAQRHLHPDLLQIVAVGDSSRIGPDLEALELGPVTYSDPDGTPARQTS